MINQWQPPLSPFRSSDPRQDVCPLVLLKANDVNRWLQAQKKATYNWCVAHNLAGKQSGFLSIPNAQGKIEQVVVVTGEEPITWLADAATWLPTNMIYGLAADSDYHDEQLQLAILGWGLAQYQYRPYLRGDGPIRLLAVANSDVISLWEAISMVRDLVNAPPDDLNPEALAHITLQLAEQFGGQARQICGQQLLTSGFPAIYAVGRAAPQEPRLIELTWGDPEHTAVTLVGKGVTFDTGGLDLKSANGMILMKKDMGGAAHVLALARLIMQAKLPIFLRLLIPAVENSIDSNSLHPSDIIETRQGLTVEIGNTDAEGRLILSDALTYASEHNPELIIDIATLTGAARVALGPDLPAMFSNDDNLAQSLRQTGGQVQDPVWPMPLYQPYLQMLNSKVADINNAASAPFAGAITAALFLQQFVGASKWLHFDVMAYNTKSRPAKPEGGEAMGLRTIFNWLQTQFAANR